MAMKRKFSDTESLDIAKCLILLSHNLQNKPFIPIQNHTEKVDIFECKTCNKKFSSFQALGGHRASHKKPKLPENNNNKQVGSETTKRKLHECSICGAEFALGQALGGHMRRHRAAVAMSYDYNGSHHRIPKLPVLKRSNSSKRVFGLDLNRTPLENDLEYLFGKMAPKVDPLLI